MKSTVAQADALIDELRAKAANAARRNKPTMWAYYLDCADGLAQWFGDVERTDPAYALAALALSDSAQSACPNLQPMEAARLWARGIYARRILSSSGFRADRRVDLRWLRERVA